MGLCWLRLERLKSYRPAFWEKHNIDDECKTKTIYNDINEDFETTDKCGIKICRGFPKHFISQGL